jgi:ACDE family multidrug resistance protein
LSTTSYLTGAVIKKRTTLMKWLLVTGLFILCGSVLSATWLARNAWLLVGLMSVGAAGTALILPSLNMLITSAVAKENRGIVTSFYGSVRFLGVAFGPPVFTWLLSISTSAMFLTVAALAAGCGVLVLLLVHPEPASPDPSPGNLPVVKIPARHKARA